MKKGTLFIISGPTASGKTSVVKKFLAQTSLPFAGITTCTTREKREGEVDGVDYHFFTESEFKEKINQAFFLEWAIVHNNYYGTPKQPVFEALAKGTHVILNIDVQGALEIQKNKPEAVLIFIDTENLDDIKDRIITRHGSVPDDLDIRLASAEKERQLAHKYNYHLINKNNQLDQTVTAFGKIVEQSCIR